MLGIDDDLTDMSGVSSEPSAEGLTAELTGGDAGPSAAAKQSNFTCVKDSLCYLSSGILDLKLDLTVTPANWWCLHIASTRE